MPLPLLLRDRLRIPVVAAPMFLTSGPDLVVACSRAGILGTFPALNQRTTEGLVAWLDEIDERLTDVPGAAPYGVNLIVHRTNARLEADLAAIVDHRVPVVITSLGAATDVIDAVHSYGGVVFHDVTTLKHARKAAEAGVDGLICVAAGAGGHAGTTNPFALVAEVRAFFEGTVLLAGCLSTGSDVAAAEVMGADLAYLGTRFIATEEALVGEDYKQMVVSSGAADILYTPAISTVAASFLRPSVVAAGIDPDHLVDPERVDLAHITDPHDPAHQPSEAKPWRDVWSAGQGVAGVHDCPPAAELVARLVAEYEHALAGAARRASRTGVPS